VNTPPPNGINPRIWKLYLDTYNRVEKQLDKMKATPDERNQFQSLIRSSVWSLASIQAWQQQVREKVAASQEAAVEREKNKRRKPNAKQNAQILKLTESGLSAARIATKLEISERHVKRIRSESRKNRR